MPTIEIDGQTITVDGSKMIIEVADKAGIPIPRFCYHKKLSIAANCRMCLVEVEKAPKPLPACATPIMDGMKVFTKSPLALSAQKAVMEFLLINHPLDCPICDQGGECELQDVSMGYGSDVSRYTEKKRVVEDENLGSLIATDMTRCIHCTRCVRFGEEIAGVRELGATGRGEDMRIGTYVEHAMRSEVSGNVIDLCPVGALTSKPFRYTARAWELQQAASIAPHDCLGSHLFLHTCRGKVMRVVPKEHEALNQTWLSDRDRFSYAGLNHEDRLTVPLVKENGQWREMDWQSALLAASQALLKTKEEKGPDQIAALASASATTEELYLFQKVIRGLGSHNIDHRLQVGDFDDQSNVALFPGMTLPFAQIENQNVIVLVGSDVQREQPLAAIRIRKAIEAGAKVIFINTHDVGLDFKVDQTIIVHPSAWAHVLAALAKTTSKTSHPLLKDIQVSEQCKDIGQLCQQAESALVVLGAMAINHYQASSLRAFAQLFAKNTNSHFAEFSHGANAAGAWLAGAVPHRLPGGQVSESPGRNAHDQWADNLSTYVLLGCEPEFDSANPALALKALRQADTVIALSAFQNEGLLDYADIMLPMSLFAETSGTFMNVEGTFQHFEGAVPPPGEVRPAWKILRVLGNLLNLEGFDFQSRDDVFNELQASLGDVLYDNKAAFMPAGIAPADDTVRRVTQWPMTVSDALVRHSDPLQRSACAEEPMIHMNTATAKQFNCRHGKTATAVQNGAQATLTVCVSDRIADGCVYIPTGYAETADLGDAFGEVILK